MEVFHTSLGSIPIGLVPSNILFFGSVVPAYESHKFEGWSNLILSERTKGSTKNSSISFATPLVISYNYFLYVLCCICAGFSCVCMVVAYCAFLEWFPFQNMKYLTSFYPTNRHRFINIIFSHVGALNSPFACLFFFLF